MGVTDLQEIARREIGYVREDVAALRQRASDVSPQRKTALILVAGAAALIYGFSLWTPAIGWISLGVCLLFAGFVLVDLDPPTRRRRRSPRKKLVP